MGKLVTVVGNSGVGKTTLVNKLCEAGSFMPILEITNERPFLQKFKNNLKGFSLANQVDFLIYQAEMQIYVIENDIVGVQDGGLDQSFHIFTKRFHQKGYLDESQYKLCERLYSTFRLLLPLPDLKIVLNAPHSIIAERMKKRGREIDIERSKDLLELEKLFNKWLEKEISVPIIHIDASKDDPSYANIINDLLRNVKLKLNI